jgi:hypothetical protein
MTQIAQIEIQIQEDTAMIDIMTGIDKNIEIEMKNMININETTDIIKIGGLPLNSILEMKGLQKEKRTTRTLGIGTEEMITWEP